MLYTRMNIGIGDVTVSYNGSRDGLCSGVDCTGRIVFLARVKRASIHATVKHS